MAFHYFRMVFLGYISSRLQLMLVFSWFLDPHGMTPPLAVERSADVWTEEMNPQRAPWKFAMTEK